MRGSVVIGVVLVVVGVAAGSTTCWVAGCVVLVVQVVSDVAIVVSSMRRAGPYRSAVAAALLDGRWLSWPGRWVLRRMCRPR